MGPTLNVGDYVRLDKHVEVRVPVGIKGVVIALGDDGYVLVRVPFDRMLFEAHAEEVTKIGQESEGASLEDQAKELETIGE